MAEVNLYLKKPNNQGLSLIYLYLRYKGNTVKISTEKFIRPEHWDGKKQRVKPAYVAKNKDLIGFLGHRKGKLESEFTKQQIINPSFTPEQLRAAYNIAIGTQQVKKITLLGFIEKHVSTLEQTKRPKTIIAYKQTLKYLKLYAAKKKRKVDFNNIDLSFYNDFTGFLFTEAIVKKDKEGNAVKIGMRNNTVGKHIKNLKTFMNKAHIERMHDNLKYKEGDFKIVHSDVDTVYLNDQEIKALYSLDLAAKPGYDKVRDLFVIGCYTGLRFGDLSKPDKYTIDLEKEQISLRTEKTTKPVTVPIGPVVASILKKYQGIMPKALVNQKANKYLKEISKLAGLSDKLVISHVKGNKTENVEHYKYELISTHTARRSFATNYYLKGISAREIMAITGHKTEAAFRKYINIDNEQNAQKLLSFMKKEQLHLKIVS